MSAASILLVEDQPDDVVLTLRAFQKNGFEQEVAVVRDGVEALDYLEARGSYAGRDRQNRPALIVLDLKLPRVGGLELLEQLKQIPHLRLIRVVVLTSSLESEDLVASYEHGACSYIRKPIDFDDFLVVVAKIADYWLKLNQPVLR